MKTFRDYWGHEHPEEFKKQCAILNISPPFTQAELKSAYRSAIKVCHEDVGGSKEQAQATIAAYDSLQFFVSEELTEKQIQEIEWHRTRIEDLEPFKNYGDCPRCGGKGRWVEERESPIYAGDGDTCPKCGGDGQYKVLCRACSGTGVFKQMSGREVECRRCRGTKVFAVGICRECDGDGIFQPSRYFGHIHKIIGHKTEQVRRECFHCDGTGRIALWNPVFPKGRMTS